MPRSQLFCLGLCLLFTASNGVLATETEKKEEAPKKQLTILTPTETVNSLQEVVIQTKAIGKRRPVILVRSEDDLEWWIQPRAKKEKKGIYRGLARFGNESAPEGTEFRLVVIAPTTSKAKLYKTGDTLLELPEDVLRSEELRLTLERRETMSVLAEIDTEVILQPKNGNHVTRISKIVGKVPPKIKATPVLLVRSAEPNSLWWIQPILSVNSKGQFLGRAHFGNIHTPKGSKFKLMVIFSRNTEQLKEFSKAGATLAEIPEGVIRSPELEVILK